MPSKRHLPTSPFPSLPICRINGNTALHRDIYPSVSAQIQKNFAKSKWRVRGCCREPTAISPTHTSCCQPAPSRAPAGEGGSTQNLDPPKLGLPAADAHRVFGATFTVSWDIHHNHGAAGRAEGRGAFPAVPHFPQLEAAVGSKPSVGFMAGMCPPQTVLCWCHLGVTWVGGQRVLASPAAHRGIFSFPSKPSTLQPSCTT